MTATPRPTVDTVGATLVAVTRILAAQGVAAADAVLELVREQLGTRALTLRTGPGGDVIARAPRAQQVPAPRDPRVPWLLDVPVRHCGATRAVLTATGDEPLPASAAELLGAVADALASALAAGPAPYPLAALAVLDLEADRAQLAADLDEHLREALVALLHTDPTQTTHAVGAALGAARQICRELRATALNEGLRPALNNLRVEGAHVDADDPALDRVAPAVAVVVERVAEAASRGATEMTRITARVVGGEVKLRVEPADNAVDASELERWARRAHALRGELRHWPGGVELCLPVGPSDEGRHDHGPHL